MKYGIRYSLEDPQYPGGHASYWIFSKPPDGAGTTRERLEYLCKVSGHPDTFRILATRNLPRDEIRNETQWRKMPPTESRFLGPECTAVREVPKEEVVAILLAADKKP